MLSEKQTDTRDDLYFMFNLINLSTEITKRSNINHISKYGKKKSLLFVKCTSLYFEACVI